MKANQVLVICGVAAALCLGVGTLSAQDNNTNSASQGRRGNGGGGGNFDPAQFQQRMMDNIRERLAFTNETDWAAVQPLIQKEFDARRDVGFGGRGFGGFGRRGGGGGGNNAQGGRGGGFGQSSPEADALQKALDDNAPAAQVKAVFEKYRAARKAKEAKLAQAQEDLRKVLTPRQEAQATLLGLLD
jgi:Spy/CpxP family protein refolding chaperone